MPKNNKKDNHNSEDEQDGGYGVPGQGMGNQNARGKGPKQQAAKNIGSKKSNSNSNSKKSSNRRQNGGDDKPVKPKKSNSMQKGGDDKNDSEQEPGKRYFKVYDDATQESNGRYTGDTPKQAASKAYTKLVQKMKQNGGKLPKSTTLYLRESTRGKHKKIYGYTASRIKLDEPQELKIKDKDTGAEKTIKYNYRNKIKKFQVPAELAGGAAKKVRSTPTSKNKSGSKTSRDSSKASTSKSTARSAVSKSRNSNSSKNATNSKNTNSSKNSNASKNSNKSTVNKSTSKSNKSNTKTSNSKNANKPASRSNKSNGRQSQDSDE